MDLWVWRPMTKHDASHLHTQRSITLLTYLTTAGANNNNQTTNLSIAEKFNQRFNLTN